MSKKTLTLITLTFFINFLISCSTTTTQTGTEVFKSSPSSVIEAKKLQEVQLITASGEIHRGKLSRLEGRDLVLLPFPYWNIEPIKIDLDEIHSIKLVKKSKKAGKGFAGGFAWGFIIIGTLAGLSSRYDEDFQMALLGSAVSGAFFGFLGFLIGGISDISAKSEYDFSKMPDSEKIRAIKKIMGL